MRGPKKVPVEVVERAKAVALTRQYTIAPEPAVVALKKKPAREKVVAALKKLHPMD